MWQWKTVLWLIVLYYWNTVREQGQCKTTEHIAVKVNAIHVPVYMNHTAYKCVHFHNCSEVFFVLVLKEIWHWVQCGGEGNSLGICGNSWLCVCISSTGDHCTHALIHRRAQDRRQLCSVWEPGQRIYPAFPLRCQSRQPSFDSLTFQF